MNVVLYTRDMEPITIIDLPLWALEHGEKEGVVRVGVPDFRETLYTPIGPPEPIPELMPRTVFLEFHRLYMPGRRTSWLVTVNDDVLALKLRPSWLPGQQAKINEYERTKRELTDLLVAALGRGR